MTIYVAACALIDPDGRILIARRPKNKPHPLLWEFPGGKIEDGETPEKTIARELREELNIDPCESCLQPFSFVSHSYEKYNILMVLYICRQWDGFAKACEGQTLKWVFPNKLEDYELVAADIPLAKELRDRLPVGKRFLK